MVDDETIEIPPTHRLAATAKQRNRANDEAAAWEAVAVAEQEKVRSLTAELMRMAARLDELEPRDPTPGDASRDVVPVTSVNAEWA